MQPFDWTLWLALGLTLLVLPLAFFVLEFLSLERRIYAADARSAGVAGEVGLGTSAAGLLTSTRGCSKSRRPHWALEQQLSTREATPAAQHFTRVKARKPAATVGRNC